MDLLILCSDVFMRVFMIIMSVMPGIKMSTMTPYFKIACCSRGNSGAAIKKIVEIWMI